MDSRNKSFAVSSRRAFFRYLLPANVRSDELWISFVYGRMQHRMFSTAQNSHKFLHHVVSCTHSMRYVLFLFSFLSCVRKILKFMGISVVRTCICTHKLLAIYPINLTNSFSSRRWKDAANVATAAASMPSITNGNAEIRIIIIFGCKDYENVRVSPFYHPPPPTLPLSHGSEHIFATEISFRW